jgi:hypothetical protein
MTRARPAPGDPAKLIYHARVPATLPADRFTARIIPACAGAAVPLECSRILWQR